MKMGVFSVIILILSGSIAYSYGNYPPVANLTADPTSAAVNEDITFDGSASYDPSPGGSIVKYEWDWTNDGSYDYNETPGDGIAVHSYGSPGSYTVKLRVTDNQNAIDTDTTMVMVSSGGPIYVDSSVSGGGNDGSSWADAYNYLQDAFDAASAGDVIWVANGIYKPDEENVGSDHTPDDRSETFQLIEGVAVYGGFAGGEVFASFDLDDRNFKDNKTILSGDLYDNDEPDFVNYDENSYNVVTGADEAIIDGFTITGGNAGSGGGFGGGGMLNLWCSPTVSNCSFVDNTASYGGGMSNISDEEYPPLPSPTVSNCSFVGNTAFFDGGMFSSYGGGMFSFKSSPTVSNCSFVDNTSVNGDGGGMYSAVCSPTITNCVFNNNSAMMGGGIYIIVGTSSITNCVFYNNTSSGGGGAGAYLDISTTVTNCTFYNNHAEGSGLGGGIRLSGYNTFTIKNSIFWDNTDGGTGTVESEQIHDPTTGYTDITYSCIQDADPDDATIPFGDSWNNWNNNIDDDPLFANDADPDGADNIWATDDDGLLIGNDSSCIDKGSDAAIGAIGDIVGNPRKIDGDHQITSPDSDAITVDMGAYELPPIWHVTSTGTGDGYSWATSASLQDTLTNYASAGDEIWVKAGIYKPHASDRTVSFALAEDVRVYGGFNGTETALIQRDFVNNKAILSGDIGVGNDVNDNSYHVVTVANSATLDGFTIMGGNANGTDANSNGGGIYCSSSDLTVERCIITANSAEEDGGGIYCDESVLNLTNCVIVDNDANNGGGIYDSNSSPTITNCTFNGNIANGDGGGIYNYGSSSPLLTNCLIWGNSAISNGEEIYNATEVGYNPNFSYCDVNGCGGSESWDPNFGIDGGGNIDSNPNFRNANNPAGSDGIFGTWDDGLRIDTTSPCADAADGDIAPSTGILGLERFDINNVSNTGTGNPNYADMGAYEWQTILYVDVNAPAGGNGLSWATAFDTIQEGINAAVDGDMVIVAKGTYYENINFNGKKITLTSTDYGDPNVVALTIIDGSSSGNVVTFNSSEDTNSVIAGFTIRNCGNDTINAGISCTYGTSSPSPLIRDCNITGNNSNGIYTSGSSSPEIINCMINNNTRHGIYLFSGSKSLISGCTITENGSPGNTGHGIYLRSSAPTIENCIISSNSGIGSTGISCYSGCSPKINNCIINDNASVGISLGQNNSSANISGCEINSNIGGGVYSGISGTYIAISNSVISKNSGYGLNIRDNDSSVTNCTIAGNTSYGITAALTFDNIKNCIIWGNTDDLYNCNPTFSCIGESHSGVGNFTVNDPCFVNYTNNDFHLKSSSSICIDTGEPWADYSLEPSPNGSRINLGAYGNTSEATATTDTDSDGLSDAWEEYYFEDINSYDAAGNPDTDDFNNLAEYLFGYDPCTINNDVVGIFNPTLSTSQIDPTLGETLTVGYWLNMDASVDVNCFTTSEIVRTISIPSASAGYNSTIWYGKDNSSLIVEDDFYDIAIDANDNDGNTVNIAAGSVQVVYTHAISNVFCNPYRIIPINNEVSKITYDITIDANMVVTVYDPCGVNFVTLLDDILQTGTSQEVIWYGKDGDPNDPDSRYITKEGEYLIEVKFKGMREKAQGAVTAYK